MYYQNKLEKGLGLLRELGWASEQKRSDRWVSEKGKSPLGLFIYFYAKGEEGGKYGNGGWGRWIGEFEIQKEKFPLDNDCFWVSKGKRNGYI